MTDNWDFYFCNVNDSSASIFVDLDAVKVAPVENLPYMAYIKLSLLAPREDGLSSSEEFDALSAIEDAFEEKLVNDTTAYVGRCTTDGRRDYVFYTNDEAGWTVKVRQVMQSFASYKFEAGARSDIEWSTYLSFLSPSPIERQSIENRRVCASLEQHGDQLTAPREIDHWAYFYDDLGRRNYINESAELGYKLKSTNEPEPSSDTYGVVVCRIDTPSYREIDDATIPLYRLAEKHSGAYDGWETQVVI